MMLVLAIEVDVPPWVMKLFNLDESTAAALPAECVSPLRFPLQAPVEAAMGKPVENNDLFPEARTTDATRHEHVSETSRTVRRQATLTREKSMSLGYVAVDGAAAAPHGDAGPSGSSPTNGGQHSPEAGSRPEKWASGVSFVDSKSSEATSSAPTKMLL